MTDMERRLIEDARIEWFGHEADALARALEARLDAEDLNVMGGEGMIGTQTLAGYTGHAREAKKRAEEATVGPWGYMRPTREGAEEVFACPPGLGAFSWGVRGVKGRIICTLGLPVGNPDTPFISHARTDVPVLADAVIRLAAEVGRLSGFTWEEKT